VRKVIVAIPRAFGLVWQAGHALTAIILLDNGGLVEEGSHEDLLARDGLYASMFETQAERYR
jgi:ABC-type transport system involved in cytochrome bd biosynthesis fused ATPase/permease subunit